MKCSGSINIASFADYNDFCTHQNVYSSHATMRYPVTTAQKQQGEVRQQTVEPEGVQLGELSTKYHQYSNKQ